MPRPALNSSHRLLAVTVALLFLLPTVAAQESMFNASRKTSKDIPVNYQPDAGIEWDETINQFEEGFKTNLDSWGPFTENHNGKWVGGMSPEQLVAVNTTDNQNNITVAGLHTFTPHDVMGAGMSEGWVRSPLQLAEGAATGMDIYHVQNPQFANLIPGLGIPAVTGVASNWSKDGVVEHFEGGLPENEAPCKWQSEYPADPHILWCFEDGSGVVAADSSGNGNDGTLENSPTWSTGKVGNSILFDGVNDRVYSADDAASGGWTEASIGCWMYVDGLTSIYGQSGCTVGWQWVGGASWNYQSLFVGIHGTQLYGGAVAAPSEGESCTGTGGFPDECSKSASAVPNYSPDWSQQWVHGAVTFDNGEQKIYVNGVLRDTRTLAYPFLNTPGAGGVPVPTYNKLTAAGSASSATGSPLGGWVDEVFLYEKALSAAEIATIYEVTTPENRDGTFVLGSATDPAALAANMYDPDILWHDPNMLTMETDEQPAWDWESEADGGGAIGLAQRVWAGKEESDYWCPSAYPGTPTALFCLEESGATATDYGSNGNDATLLPTLTSWGAGKLGGGLYTGAGTSGNGGAETAFDTGVGGYTELTAAVWYYGDNAEPYLEDMLTSGSHCFTGGGGWDLGSFCIGAHTTSIEYQVFTSDGPSFDKARCTHNPPGDIGGGWRHLAISWDGSSQVMTGYYDGQPVCTDTTVYATINTPSYGGWNDLTIGCDTQKAYCIEGTVDEAVVYDVKLSDEDIEAIYEITVEAHTYADELAGQWLFAGTPAATWDTSGNDNHGDACIGVADCQPAPGYIGEGVVFDGVDDKIEVDDAAQFFGGTSATWQMWLNPSVVAGNHVVLDKASVVRIFINAGSTDYIYVNVNGLENGGTGNCDESSPFVVDKWQMLTVTYDAGDGYLRHYYNGVETRACDLNQQGHPLDNNANNLVFGAQSGGSRWYEGSMDEVNIWHRALNSSEIYSLYLATYDLHEKETYLSTYGSFAGVEQAYVSPTTVIELAAEYSDSISESHPGRAYMPDNYCYLTADAHCDLSNYTAPGNPNGMWLFDEGQGPVVGDSSGNGHGGVIQGGTWSGGAEGNPGLTTQLGTAVDYDGDYTTIPYSPELDAGTGSMSWAMWFKIDAFNGGENAIFSMYEPGPLIFVESNGKLTCRLYGDTGGGGMMQATTALAAINTDIWYHLACVRDTDAGDALLYIDGVLTDTQADGSGDLTTTRDLTIGNSAASGYGWPINGKVDELLIYDFALDAGEIDGIYQQANGFAWPKGMDLRLQSGQIGYWPLDYGSGNWIYDHSRNTNTGDSWHGVVDGGQTHEWTFDCRLSNNPCLTLDGVEDWVYTDSVVEIAGDYTLAAWSRISASGSHTVMMQPAIGGGAVPGNWQFRCHDADGAGAGDWYWWNYALTPSTGQAHSSSCDDGQWQHMVLVYSSSADTVTIYQNGAAISTIAVTGTMAVADTGLWIGSNTGQWDFFDGELDELALWGRALPAPVVTYLYENSRPDCVTIPLTCNPKPQSGHLSHFEVWGSNTPDISTATKQEEWDEGVDYYMSAAGGRNMLNLVAAVPYYQYWWWSVNMSNEAQSTPIIHSVMLEMELFTQPYTLVPNPLSDPDLCWSNQYGAPDDDDLHEYYNDPGSSAYGRHYLNFKCPIYAGRDVNGDSLSDDAYLFVFTAAPGSAFNDTHELWLSQSSRGMDFMKSWAYTYDMTKLWMNDTLPLSLGSDIFFTRGMNYGITGWELPQEGLAVPVLEFYSKLPEPFAEGDYLTFHLPFELPLDGSGIIPDAINPGTYAGTPYNDCTPTYHAGVGTDPGASYYVTVSGYDDDMILQGSTFSHSQDYTYDDTLLISGDDGNGYDGMWDDSNTELVDSTILKFEVEIGYYTYPPFSGGAEYGGYDAAGGCHTVGGYKIYTHDSNSDFDMAPDEANFFNKFWVMPKSGEPPLEQHTDFAVVHSAMATDSFWHELNTVLPNNAPVTGPKYLYDAFNPGIHENALVCLTSGLKKGYEVCAPSSQLTDYEIEFINNADEWASAGSECGQEVASGHTSAAIYDCTKFLTWDSGKFAYQGLKFYGSTHDWGTSASQEDIIDPQVGHEGFVTFKEIYSLLNFQDGIMWEAAWLVGAFAEGVITVGITVLQENVNLITDFLVMLSRILVFLMISGSIIGSTSVLFHGLHGRWHIVNYKCGSSLTQAAGFLSVVPFVGGGMTSSLRSGIGSLTRGRPKLRKPSQRRHK